MDELKILQDKMNDEYCDLIKYIQELVTCFLINDFEGSERHKTLISWKLNNIETKRQILNKKINHFIKMDVCKMCGKLRNCKRANRKNDSLCDFCYATK
jgi:hypothetical protein